jgi:hypothetical protein
VQSFLAGLIEAAYPDANRDGSAASEPYRSLHLIGLIRTLFDYGMQLIVTARQRAGTPGFLAFAAPFGTASLKLLIARISCAVARAAQLQQRLQYEAGLGGIYRPEPAQRGPTDRAARARPAAQSARAPTRQAAPVRQAAPAVDPELAHLPTVAQIATEIRRLPIEQVIASICHDFGITPEHALWQELAQALAAFGISLAGAAKDAEAAPTQPSAAQPGRDTQPTAVAASPARSARPDCMNRVP